MTSSRFAISRSSERRAISIALAAALAAPLAWGSPARAADRRAEALAKDALRRATRDYVARNYKAATARLEKAARTCGADRCTPATKAAVWRDLGTMEFRAGDADVARTMWASALQLQPDIDLNAAYDKPDVRKAWEEAKGASAATSTPTSTPTPTPTPTPPPRGDVVQQIDLSASSSSAPAPEPAPTEPPPSSAPSRDTFRLRGFARTRFSAAIAGENAAPGEPSALRVPWEPLEGQPQLFAELRYAHGKVFEATISGVLDYELFARTVYDPSTGAPTQTTRGAYTAMLREAYVGTTFGAVSLRIGQQRIAWGNSDAFPINDVLDPRDVRDPVLVETELRYLPVFAARADFALSRELELELVAEPFFASDAFDVYGTPWAVIQPTAPVPLRGLFGRLNATTDPSLDAALAPVLRQTSLPYDDLSGASAAAKLAYTGEGFDAAVGYDYGLGYQPALSIAPPLAQQLGTTDWTKATSADLTPVLAALQSGQFSSTYPRRHHVGAWMAKVLSPFVLRGEAAYDSATVFLDPNLFGVVRPTAQAVAALEWQSGEIGKALVVEQYYERILGDAPGPLLGARIDTVATAAVARWTFFDHIEAEVRAVVGEQPLGYVLRPQLAYKSGAWELRAGLAWIDGDDGSLPHYYRRNTSAYVIGKVSF